MTMPDLTTSLTDSQKINLNVISLNTAMNNIQEQLEYHDKVLIRGNGEISLREQVRINTRFIDGIRKVAWVVFSAIIIQTIAFASAIAVAYIRFLPLLEKIANQSTP